MSNAIRYDKTEMIVRASQLFWERGFHATSMRDLQSTLDMRPGSIYAAFGSKEGLYVEALIAYAELAKSKFETGFEKANSVLEGLRFFVEDILIDDVDELANKICFMTRTLTEVDNEYEGILETCNKLQTEFEKKLTKIFKRAIDSGELSSNLTALEYARLFQVQFSGLRSYLLRKDTPGFVRQQIDLMFRIFKAV